MRLTLLKQRLIYFNLYLGQHHFLDALLKPITCLNRSTNLLCLRLRFAFELDRAGVVAEYEYPTGNRGLKRGLSHYRDRLNGS